MKRLVVLLGIVCVLVWVVDGDAQRRLNRAGRGTPSGSGDPLRGVGGKGASGGALSCNTTTPVWHYDTGGSQGDLWQAIVPGANAQICSVKLWLSNTGVEETVYIQIRDLYDGGGNQLGGNSSSVVLAASSGATEKTFTWSSNYPAVTNGTTFYIHAVSSGGNARNGYDASGGTSSSYCLQGDYDFGKAWSTRFAIYTMQ